MEIIRYCKHHGDLTEKDIIKSGISHGKQKYKCKKCMKKTHHENYLKNKDKIISRNKNNFYNDLDKYRLIKNKSRKKRYHEKYKNCPEELKRKKDFDRKQCLELSDRYVRFLLTKRNSLTAKDIPQSLIDLKRVLLKMRRMTK